MKLQPLLDLVVGPLATDHVGQQAGQGGSLFWVIIAAVALIASSIALLVRASRRRRK